MVSDRRAVEQSIDLLLSMVVTLSDQAPTIGRGLDRADRLAVMTAHDALLDACANLAPWLDLDRALHLRRHRGYGVSSDNRPARVVS